MEPRRALANRNLFPEFRELWSWGPGIPCGELHWCTCKVFFDNFSVFSDSFSVVSIRCVDREL